MLEATNIRSWKGNGITTNDFFKLPYWSVYYSDTNKRLNYSFKNVEDALVGISEQLILERKAKTHYHDFSQFYLRLFAPLAVGKFEVAEECEATKYTEIHGEPPVKTGDRVIVMCGGKQTLTVIHRSLPEVFHRCLILAPLTKKGVPSRNLGGMLYMPIEDIWLLKKEGRK